MRDPARFDADTLFRTVADDAPVMLWISGADGLCSFFNREWLAFTGRSLADELGRGWWQGVHHEDRDRLARHLQHAGENRSPFSFEYRLRRADGQYRWVDRPRLAAAWAFWRADRLRRIVRRRHG